MEITKDYLEKELKNIQDQRDQAAAVMLQADGAISAMRAMLNKIDEAEKPPEG